MLKQATTFLFGGNMKYILLLFALITSQVHSFEVPEAEKDFVNDINTCFKQHIKEARPIMIKLGLKNVTAKLLGYDAKTMEYNIRYYTKIKDIEYSFTRSYQCVLI